MQGPAHFAELRRTVPNISERMLSDAVRTRGGGPRRSGGRRRSAAACQLRPRRGRPGLPPCTARGGQVGGAVPAGERSVCRGRPGRGLSLCRQRRLALCAGSAGGRAQVDAADSLGAALIAGGGAAGPAGIPPIAPRAVRAPGACRRRVPAERFGSDSTARLGPSRRAPPENVPCRPSAPGPASPSASARHPPPIVRSLRAPPRCLSVFRPPIRPDRASPDTRSLPRARTC